MTKTKSKSKYLSTAQESAQDIKSGGKPFAAVKAKGQAGLEFDFIVIPGSIEEIQEVYRGRERRKYVAEIVITAGDYFINGVANKARGGERARFDLGLVNATNYKSFLDGAKNGLPILKASYNDAAERMEPKTRLEVTGYATDSEVDELLESPLPF